MKKTISFFVVICLAVSLFAPFAVSADPSEEMVELAADIADALMNSIASDGHPVVDISKYNLKFPDDVDFLRDTCEYLRYSYPDLFFVDFSSYSTGIQSMTSIKSLTFNYRFETWVLSSKRQEYEKLLGACLDDIAGWKPTTDLAKVLAVHRYLIQNFEYDLNLEVRDSYTMLKTRVGVCEGYTALFIALLDRLGVEASFVISEDMVHAWNLVRIDGEWYHIDNTWDDPTYDLGGGESSTGNVLDRISDKNFLKSDAAFLVSSPEKGKHYGAKAYYACTSTLYDGYFWDSTHSGVFSFGKDDFWYITLNGTFMHTGSEGYTELAYINDRWYTYQDGARTNKYYVHSSGTPANYSVLEFYADCFYYNDCDHVYKYSMADKTSTVVFENDPAEGNIFGIRRNGNVLSIEIAKDMQNPGVIRTITLEEGALYCDFNKDGIVDSDDAIYLLRHILFPGDFPVDYEPDLNGDGAFSSDDAIYLLRHVLFPNDFPLN